MRETSHYYLKKVGQLILTIIVLTVVVFFVSRLAPGNPLKAYYGEEVEKMSVEQLEAARERLGLNDPLPVQYAKWASEAVGGDFGISYQYKQPVIDVVGEVWGNTAALAAVSFFLIFVLGLLLAIYCVRHEGRWTDKLICRIGVATNSIPEFFVGLILILVFSVTLAWLPASGAHSLEGDGFFDRAQHLILPVSAIVISHLWYCTYLMRNKLSEEMRKEYILLCRAKGLSERRIIYGHCLKNILPASISMMAIFLPHLLGGAYIVETVFSYPGIGRLCIDSALYHDYNMLMIVCLLTGVIVTVVNLTAQVINEKLDPRMKEEGSVAR